MGKNCCEYFGHSDRVCCWKTILWCYCYNGFIGVLGWFTIHNRICVLSVHLPSESSAVSGNPTKNALQSIRILYPHCYSGLNPTLCAAVMRYLTHMVYASVCVFVYNIAIPIQRIYARVNDSAPLQRIQMQAYYKVLYRIKCRWQQYYHHTPHHHATCIRCQYIEPTLIQFTCTHTHTVYILHLNAFILLLLVG